MTIGLICAIPQELGHLRELLTHTGSEEAAHTRFDFATFVDEAAAASATILRRLLPVL